MLVVITVLPEVSMWGNHAILIRFQECSNFFVSVRVGPCVLEDPLLHNESLHDALMALPSETSISGVS